VSPFGKTEILAVLTPDQVKATRDKIALKFPEPPSQLTPLQRFLKWSVSEAWTRTISPFSDLTVANWIENRIKDGTSDGLRAAMLVDPANARLAAHFGMALANLAVAAELNALLSEDKALGNLAAAEETDPDEARRAPGRS